MTREGPESRASRFAVALGIATAAALLLRILLLVIATARGGRLITPDGYQYLTIARNLAHHSAFSAGEALPLFPTMARAPGYPLWLAGLLLLVPEGATTVWPAFAGQVLLGTAGVWLVGWLARFVVPDRWAVVVAALFAVSFGQLAHSVMLSSEMPFSVLVLAALGCLFTLRRTGRWPLAAAAGALFGLAILTRPIGILLPLGLAPAAAVKARTSRQGGLLPVGLLLGTALLVCLPWVVRNQETFGVPFLSAAEGDVLLIYDAASFVARRDRAPLDSVRVELRENARAAAAAPPGAPVDPRTESRLALRLILRHPLAYAWYHARTSVNSLLPSVTELTEVAGVTSGSKGTMTVLADSGAAAAVSRYTGWRAGPARLIAATLYLVIGLCALGTAAAALLVARHEGWAVAWLLVVPVVLLVFLTGAAAHPRFSVPIWGPLLILWAAALHALRPGQMSPAPYTHVPTGRIGP